MLSEQTGFAVGEQVEMRFATRAVTFEGREQVEAALEPGIYLVDGHQMVDDKACVVIRQLLPTAIWDTRKYWVLPSRIERMHPAV